MPLFNYIKLSVFKFTKSRFNKTELDVNILELLHFITTVEDSEASLVSN